jgi:hypothetical protein
VDFPSLPPQAVSSTAVVTSGIASSIWRREEVATSTKFDFYFVRCRFPKGN